MIAVNLALAAYIGLLVGGFATVLVPRLQDRPQPCSLTRALRLLSLPPSSCACGRRLTLLEKLPVIGWLLARGTCRSCAVRVAPVYPVCELAVALLVVSLALGARDWDPLAFTLLGLIPAVLFLILLLLVPIAPRSALAIGAALSLLPGATALAATLWPGLGPWGSPWPAPFAAGSGYGGPGLETSPHATLDVLVPLFPSLSHGISANAGVLWISLAGPVLMASVAWLTSRERTPGTRVAASLCLAAFSLILPGAPSLAPAIVFPAALAAHLLPHAFASEAPGQA